MAAQLGEFCKQLTKLSPSKVNLGHFLLPGVQFHQSRLCDPRVQNRLPLPAPVKHKRKRSMMCSVMCARVFHCEASDDEDIQLDTAGRGLPVAQLQTPVAFFSALSGISEKVMATKEEFRAKASTYKLSSSKQLTPGVNGAKHRQACLFSGKSTHQWSTHE